LFNFKKQVPLRRSILCESENTDTNEVRTLQVSRWVDITFQLVGYRYEIEK
jgi:hypothetical protein